MSSQTEIELAKEFKAAQEKYIYFLLAAALSAIGYAITQLKIEPLSYSHIPLGVSILLWSISFFSGTKFIENLTGMLFQNHNYLAFKRELKLPSLGGTPELLKEFEAVFNKTVTIHQKRISFYGVLQSQTLLLGAVSYISWHVLKMLNA